MSGGSWDYFYCRIEEIADRLCQETSPERKALGKLLKKCSKALHDIEWVDSGDYGTGDDAEAIKSCLKFDTTSAIKEALKEELDRLEKFKELIK